MNDKAMLFRTPVIRSLDCGVELEFQDLGHMSKSAKRAIAKQGDKSAS